MSRYLVVGGTNVVGLAIISKLLEEKDCEKIFVVGKNAPQFKNDRIEFTKCDVVFDGIGVLDKFVNQIDGLFVNIGIKRVAAFEDIDEIEIDKYVKINFLAIAQILKKFYLQINGEKKFITAVMCSISARLVSPLFSVYGATKSALVNLIQSINTELEATGKQNRILEVSPGAFKSASFDSVDNIELAENIIERSRKAENVYIPQFEEIFKGVFDRQAQDARAFALSSYEHKLNRVVKDKSIKIGYLSGTFDLFHIGHLNLLKKAKQKCDFLIVGVHKDASHKGKVTVIPFEDRKEIVASCKYVDKVVESCPEDSDAYFLYNYDYLFVGSDYKGTERFNRYAELFKDKNVEIVFFEYTKGISSTDLRKEVAPAGSEKNN